MPLEAAKLPDDPVLLKELVSDQHGEIEHLKLVIAKLQRLYFGRRAESLALSPDQLGLAFDQAEQVASSPDKVQATPLPPVELPARSPLPPHLPREIELHTPEAHCCPVCQGSLRHIGDDVCEVLEHIPERFKVIRHVRPKMACSRCHTIHQAAAPERPIERGIAGPGLLAHVLVSKYCDHLPLYRQSQIYAREGVALPRSTLADWVKGSSQLLAPLVDALRRHTLGGSAVHADDTPVPVLAPGKGRTKTGRLWTYVRDERAFGGSSAPAVWFAYSPDRRGVHPQAHLKAYRGAIHADGYAGFNPLFESGERQDVACWAHVRRKFYEIHQAQASPLAQAALLQIGRLYRIEAEIRGRPPDERRHARQTRAGPVLDTLHDWLTTTLQQIPRKSALAEAIRYALARWSALLRYRDSGVLEIDNNAAERALRCVALGRKNYLFAGSDRGGERAAALYSLIGTAQLNGLDPQAYLRQVLGVIAQHPVNRVDELLPWNMEIVPGTANAEAA